MHNKLFKQQQRFSDIEVNKTHTDKQTQISSEDRPETTGVNIVFGDAKQHIMRNWP